MEQTRELTPAEKSDLAETLARSEPTVMLIHGEGADRMISFYADGTRLETRIPYPIGGDDG